MINSQNEYPEEEYEQRNEDNFPMEYISELVNVEKELDRFTMEVLRGKVRILNDKNEYEWVDRFPDKKIMNEKGVRGFLTILKGVVTKLSKLSNKTDEEIAKDMFYLDMRLSTAMYENGDDWELDLADFELLKESCIRLAWDVSASSRDGFTAINLKSQYTRSETSSSSNNKPQQKKIFGLNISK